MEGRGRRVLTAEALAAMGGEGKSYELWDGALVVAEPAGGASGPMGMALGARVVNHVAEHGVGAWVGDSSTGYLLRRNPDRVLSPDLSVVLRKRLPAWPAAGFPEVVPDLVAEIRSPTDTWTFVAERGGIWIAHGVRVVWLLDPLRGRVVTLRPLDPPVIAGRGQKFDGAPVLPGLRIAVDDLFAPFDLG